MTAARIILSGWTLSWSGAEPTDTAVAAGAGVPELSVCDGRIAIWIVGADDEIAIGDEPQLDSPPILTAAGGLHQPATTTATAFIMLNGHWPS